MHLIGGHGDELDVAIDVLGLGNHPVLVGNPVAVLLHIILHPVVLCVEYVATISEQRGMLKNCKTVTRIFGSLLTDGFCVNANC